jgi:hypothetical protein
MQKWQKVNNKLKAEIINIKLNNPNISDREIQRNIPSIKSNKTISNIVNKEFAQNTHSYEKIINNNISIIEQSQNIIFNWLNKVEIKDINDLSKVSNIMYHAVKQNQLINWKDNDIKQLIPSNINIQVINNI